MKLIYGLSAILFGTATTIALVPRYVVAFTPQEVKTVAPSRPVLAAMSATQVGNIARQVTVLINGQNPGSGVIIRRSGNTYTVLTARHVVATPDEYDIITPDGQKFRLNYATVKPLPGVDLATLEFTSSANYQVAKLGNSRSAPSGTTVYVAGFPVPTAAINQSIFNFTEGKITANADRPLADGYALVYSNNTLPGMSGGPVLNDAGEVIGVHGKGDTDTTSAKVTANPNVALKTGFNLAIPINTFLTLAVRTGVVGFTAPATAPISAQPTSGDLELQGMAAAQEARNLFRSKKNDEALARARLATQLAPRAYETWALLGILLVASDKTEPGINALQRALTLKKDNPHIYFSLGSAYFRQSRYNEAIRIIEQGLALKPDATDEIFSLGNSHYKLNQFPQAIAQYQRVLQIDRKFWPALNNIGLIQYEQGDRAGAMRSWQEAITLDSKSGEPKMALAAALSAQGRADQAIPLAETALRIDARFGKVDFLKENLWGERLIADAKLLLSNPRFRGF
jgi:tetratricopeptide (TPR) repeat protein